MVLSLINVLIEHLIKKIDHINGGHLFPTGVILTSHRQASIKAGCEGMLDQLIKYENLVIEIMHSPLLHS